MQTQGYIPRKKIINAMRGFNQLRWDFRGGQDLLVAPNNQGNFTEVMALNQKFKVQVDLNHVGVKIIRGGWDSLREEKTLRGRERHILEK